MKDLKFNIIRKDSIPSTQLFLSEMVQHNQVEEGTLIITGHQDSGIGHAGNHWHSTKGKNLNFSFLLTPDFLKPAEQFELTKMISLAVVHFLEKLPSFPEPVSIKWPNDIYIGNRKIAGILINNAIMGNSLEYSIIGIGLNINETDFPQYCPNPTSVYLETNIEYNLPEVLSELLDSIHSGYNLLQNDRELLDTAYLQYLYRIHEQKNYMLNGEPIRATIAGVNEYGKLLLEREDRTVIECDLKEVVYL